MVNEALENYYPLFDDGLYTEVVHQNGERAVKILKGEYKGIVYQYGKIELVPRAESEIPKINFDRAVRVCPEELLNTISEDKEFNQLMGNILIELLANQGIEELNRGVS
jgi:hypothetical protein|tara:strand:+ start:1528 stop:1854 length:327 start_codon:yes stop_codon:yes gene_type:complete